MAMLKVEVRCFIYLVGYDGETISRKDAQHIGPY